MKEVDIIKKRPIETLYIWVNNYQREITLKEFEIRFMKYRKDLIEKAIEELEELK